MKARRGFTLIEVMIVVVIVGILAAIAYPSYQDYLRKGRRASAQTFVSEIAIREQQYLLDARSYAATVAALNLTVPADVSPFYDITISATTPPPAFTITATPKGGQVPDGVLTLNNEGTKLRDGKPW